MKSGTYQAMGITVFDRAFLRGLAQKLPVFDPGWEKSVRDSWIQSFGVLYRALRDVDEESGAEAGRIRAVLARAGEIDAVLASVPLQVREDVRQEVFLELLADNEQSLRPLVRQIRSRVLQAHDLRFKTVSMDASIGDTR